jgi:hypothetical protein
MEMSKGWIPNKRAVKSPGSFIKTEKQGHFKYGHTRQVALFA